MHFASKMSCAEHNFVFPLVSQSRGFNSLLITHRTQHNCCWIPSNIRNQHITILYEMCSLLMTHGTLEQKNTTKIPLRKKIKEENKKKKLGNCSIILHDSLQDLKKKYLLRYKFFFDIKKKKWQLVSLSFLYCIFLDRVAAGWRSNFFDCK